MAEVASANDRLTRWLRWIARVIGSTAAAFWVIYFTGFVISIGLPDQLHVGVLTFGAALGAVIAWWREGIGGALLLFCALVVGTTEYLAIGYRMPFLVLSLAGPFLVAGILFLIVWRRSSSGG